MKSINTDTSSSVLDGALGRTKLKIASNWKMFKELISGIYSDKAYAIARETMANGIDSHEAAGIQSRPIRVHVPSTWEPWYSIRDFGVSMNRDLMEAVYCTLGESTKDDPNSEDSNRFVGKFGLGSKSPFAYTDSFQVTAYYDGKAHIYDVFKGVEGPEMALLSIEDTDEERGILVSFGVDPKDISDFVRAIKRAVEGLDVIPEFEGKIDLHQRIIKDEGEGWKLLDSTQSGKAEARQGTVLYPLNFQAVIDCPRELWNLFEQPFRFDFPIGTLDIVTSREALSYDEATSKNIIERLQAVQADIMKRIEEAVSGAETYWDFCRQYHRIMETYPEHRFGKLLATPPMFKGRPPKAYITVKTNGVRTKEVIDKATNKIVVPSTFKFRFGHLTYCKIGATDWNNNITFREDKNVRSNSLTIDTTHDIIVVKEDMRQKNRYPAARIAKLMDKIRIDHAANRSKTTILWIRHQGESAYVFNRMFAAFGRPVIKVLDLLDVPHDVPVRQYASGPRMPYKTLNKNGNWVTPETTDVMPGEAYYVPLRNGDVDFDEGPQFSAPFMAETLPMLVAFGCDDKPIIGIPASSRKIIANNPQWTPFYEYVVDNIDALYDEEAHLRHQFSVKARSKHPLENTLANIKTYADDDVLFADAFNGSDFEKIIKRINADLDEYAVTEDDYYQNTVVDVISRIDDRRISFAKIENDRLRAEFNAWQIDNPSDLTPFDETLLESTENRGHALRASVEKMRLAWADETYQMCEAATAEFPLLSAVNFGYTSDDSRHQRVARELLNYVFNKRLMIDDDAKSVVDIADAA